MSYCPLATICSPWNTSTSAWGMSVFGCHIECWLDLNKLFLLNCPSSFWPLRLLLWHPCTFIFVLNSWHSFTLFVSYHGSIMRSISWPWGMHSQLQGIKSQDYLCCLIEMPRWYKLSCYNSNTNNKWKRCITTTIIACLRVPQLVNCTSLISLCYILIQGSYASVYNDVLAKGLSKDYPQLGCSYNTTVSIHPVI